MTFLVKPFSHKINPPPFSINFRRIAESLEPLLLRVGVFFPKLSFKKMEFSPALNNNNNNNSDQLKL